MNAVMKMKYSEKNQLCHRIRGAVDGYGTGIVHFARAAKKSRRSIEPDVLLGAAIPAGTDVFISPYFLHRHPEHWSHPERFDPTRFAEPANVVRNRFAHIPFGVGARHCIGEALVVYEIAMHLATMVSRFRLTRIDDAPPQIEARINYRLRSDLRMRLQES